MSACCKDPECTDTALTNCSLGAVCSGPVRAVAAAAVALLLVCAAVQCAVRAGTGLLPLPQLPWVQRNAIPGSHRGAVLLLAPETPAHHLPPMPLYADQRDGLA